MPSTSDKILTLFVFEGAKTERQLVHNLEQNLLGAGHTIECVYGAEIYQLYESIKEDGLFHDIVTVLQDRLNNRKVLNNYLSYTLLFYVIFQYYLTTDVLMIVTISSDVRLEYNSPKSSSSAIALVM